MSLQGYINYFYLRSDCRNYYNYDRMTKTFTFLSCTGNVREKEREGGREKERERRERKRGREGGRERIEREIDR